MRKSVSVLCVVAAFAFVYAMSFASCGNTDPADAPIGAVVQFTQEDESWTFACGVLVEDDASTPDYDPVLGCNGGVDSRWVTAIVTDGNERTGGTSTQIGAPLNNVEIRWYTWPIDNDELWLVDDPIGQVPPLAQPYFTETDDNGTSEIIWRFYRPDECDGNDDTHWLVAAVGTAEQRLSIALTCDLPSDSGDDDDSTDSSL